MATYNEKAWAFVRKTKTSFTAWDLARVAQISYSFARKYVFYLSQAGYLRVIGKKDKEKLYRTVKITGTKPVKINHHKRVVLDENTGETYEISKINRSEVYQKLWDEIVSLRIFTSKDLYQKNITNKETIRNYLRFLNKTGYITKLDREGKYVRYKLKRYQKNYPKLDKTIQSRNIKNPQEKYQIIWNLLRTLSQFTVKELSKKFPHIHPESIRVYIKHLRRSGYLEVIKKTQYDGFLYRLVRNSGEKAPILRLSRNKPPVVYDPNKNKTYLSIGD